MVGTRERIHAALAKQDWRAWESVVEDIIRVLREPGAIPGEEILRVIDRLCEPTTKWEVKQAMAKAATRLPPMWATRVLSTLSQDANHYVRQAAKRPPR